MRYLIDLTQKQSDEIAKLINAGKYQTVAQFISTAIENQIYIESSEELSQHAEFKKKESGVLGRPDIVITNENKKIMLVEIKNQPQTVPMPSFYDLAASLYKAEEEKCWLWGQTNKILPVKIGLRVLYAIMGSGQWVDLEEYRNKSADIAAGFGTMIRKDEDRKNKIRDERISAGLPEEREFKSKTRYKGHFLAYMRKDGKLDGAMPFLRFVNLNKDEKGRIYIGLTGGGLNFARLENPVIDYHDFEKSFTEKEIDFYLNYISGNVKGESSAIKWLLSKLVSGVVERGKINEELKKEFSHIWGNASDAVINTQRAGLMARMFEMGLIEKEKQGINVTYKISSRGEIFLKEG